MNNLKDKIYNQIFLIINLNCLDNKEIESFRKKSLKSYLESKNHTRRYLLEYLESSLMDFMTSPYLPEYSEMFKESEDPTIEEFVIKIIKERFE